MKLFSERTRSGLRNDRLSWRIAKAILRRQYIMAEAINKRTEHYSRERKIVLLLLLCLLLGGLNLYVLLTGLFG